MDKVDRQRADAEDEARRGRDKVRKLTEARSIELAMEEGRRLGYEKGMRQGRLMMQARNNDINRPARYYRRTSFRSAHDDDDDQVSYFSYTQEERHSTESSRSSTNNSTSVRCVFLSSILFFYFIQFSSCLTKQTDKRCQTFTSQTAHLNFNFEKLQPSSLIET